MLGEEPRFAYDRVHLSSSSKARARATSSSGREAQYEQVGRRARPRRRPSRASTARTAPSRPPPAPRLPTTRWCSRRARDPSSAPIPGADGRGAFVTAPSRISRGSAPTPTVPRVGVVIGGGLLGLEAANALKAMGLETHVVELAPRLMAVQIDDAGGLVLRVAHRRARPLRSHGQDHRGSRARGRQRPRAQVRGRQRAPLRHGGLLRRHPPPRRARALVRSRPRRSRRHRRRRSVPHLRSERSSPSASARRSSTAATVWSRRVTAWRRRSSPRSAAKTCASPSST